MEHSNSIHTVAKLVDAGDFTKNKVRIPDRPLEINNGTSKPESQNFFSETFDQIMKA